MEGMQRTVAMLCEPCRLQRKAAFGVSRAQHRPSRLLSEDPRATVALPAELAPGRPVSKTPLEALPLASGPSWSPAAPHYQSPCRHPASSGRPRPRDPDDSQPQRAPWHSGSVPLSPLHSASSILRKEKRTKDPPRVLFPLSVQRPHSLRPT